MELREDSVAVNQNGEMAFRPDGGFAETNALSCEGGAVSQLRGAQYPKRVVLLPYQKRWVDDKSPLKIWLASRQVGKSFAIAMEAVDEALRQKCNNLILSSSERQSSEVMRKVYMHLGYCDVRSSGVLASERETREEVELPNGSRILSLPSNPDTVRGFSGNVFLDEFAFHRDTESIWRAMYPTVTRGYGIRITSTPNGKQNMFYRLWSGDSRFSRHKVSIYDAISEGLDADVDMLREGIADAEAWAQEYECEFLDEATAFLTYEMIAACEDPAATKELMARPFASAQGAHHGGHPELVEGYLGVDVGRKHDLTVFWLLEKIGDVLWTRMVREMRGVPFSLQREYLYSLMEGTYSNVIASDQRERGNLVTEIASASPRNGSTRIRRCCIDASGIGAQLAEEASQKFGSRAEAVTFTAPVKEDLAITVKRHFEERTVRIPADTKLREDLHSVQRVYTPSGNVRFDAERSKDAHADRFWALALSLHAAGAPQPSVRYEPLGLRERSRGHGCW